MSELVLGVFARKIQESMAERPSGPDILEMLYQSISTPLNLYNKKGDSLRVTADAASRVMNRRKGGNAPLIIKKNANKPEVRKTIGRYFEKNVVAKLYPQNITELITFFSNIITNDSGLSEEEKKKLLSSATVGKLADFLSGIFLICLGRDNTLVDDSAPRKKSRRKAKQLTLLDASQQPQPELTVPDVITESEHRYVGALLEVYGQKHRTRFTENMLDSFPKEKSNLCEHRRYYYHAESMRHTVSEINDGEPFRDLKEEIFEGIKEVHEESYESGEQRLREVMKQVTRISLDGCEASHFPIFSKQSIRKGVCHFLVNEGKIDGWVRDDDAEAV